MTDPAPLTVDGGPDVSSETSYLPRLLRAAAAAMPDRTALRVKQTGVWRDITWADYQRHVERLAYGFAALGVGAGDRVAIQSENRPEWLFSDVAAASLRAAIVGLYPTNPLAEVTYLLQDSGARVLVAEDQEQVDKALSAVDDCPGLEWIVSLDGRGLAGYEHPKLLSVDEVIARGERHRAEHPLLLDEIDATRSPDDLATLIYTSGTTGPPKGAMLTARNVSFASTILALPGGLLGASIGPDDALLSYLPLSHVVERGISTWANLRTHTVVHFAESIDTVSADLAEVQPTVLFGVPRIWEKIQAGVAIKMTGATRLKRGVYAIGGRWSEVIAADRIAHGGTFTPRARMLYALGYWPLYRPLRKRLGLLHVRHAISGAAPIAPDVLSFFLGLGIPLYEAYGMTENSAIATSNFAGRMIVGTVGEPHPHTELRLDETTGEVLTRHPGTFAGYWGRPEATAETVDADGWLHTGDVGEWVEGTHVRIVDRIKDIIVTAGGKNISPSEVENSFKASPYVKEAVVIGDRRPYLTALIGIEYDTVADWAARRKIEFTTYRDLSSKPEVVELIAGIIREANERFARVESVRKFRMLTKELDHEDGELTATQKLKRVAFAATVPHLIDDMYADSTAYPGADLGRNG
ncbi:AMP-binding protein [Microbacterium esteraromaticum]|uniref:Acyl-CoA synthetase n=1 Tax=Microbacterium esteraromaticum TaxID=57043 RepID=A0A939DU02_9MICO|nr:AMP-binding protein [Microbacterium esteraromaticum]MBN8205166.1 AMP-binding protein [Microbacterium esteraromaticum]MBN8415320.1 AMP-binding protein [Microbacterium esteraromaticum]MBN8424328.1 AMP-binding protein [Microbacterium esteraromaticum]